MSAKVFKICHLQKITPVKFFKTGCLQILNVWKMLKNFPNVVGNCSSYVKILEAKCYREVLGNPVTTMFLYLTFIYVYLVALIQHVLPVITIMAVWQFAHLGTSMYGYMLLAFKNICLDICRKLQKQYDTNTNRINFTMVPFLAYINQFLDFFNFNFLKSGHQQEIAPVKILKFGHLWKFMFSKFINSVLMQIFCALTELRIVFSAKVSTSNVHHKLRNTHIRYYIP